MGKADTDLRSRALEMLARTLDVKETIDRVPGLTGDTLRAILLDAAGGKMAPRPRAKKGKIVIYTDGASRGNPGLSGAGVVLKDEDGREIGQVARFLGEMTNNMAEYTALLIGLKEALKTGAEEILVCSDSELMVRQLSGRYKVKNEALQILHGSAMDLLSSFKRWKASHISRDKNTEADRLANQAIDRRS